jgi:large subunit ribosomal protein L7/L12
MADHETAQGAEGPREAFDVILEAVGDKKVIVIRVLRQVASLDLAPAKALADAAPARVLAGVDLETAELAKQALEAVGATVAIK